MGGREGREGGEVWVEAGDAAGRRAGRVGGEVCGGDVKEGRCVVEWLRGGVWWSGGGEVCAEEEGRGAGEVWWRG